MKKFLMSLLTLLLLACVMSMATACSGDTPQNKNLTEKCALADAEKYGREAENSSTSSARLDFKSAKIKSTKYSEPNYIVEVAMDIETTLSYGGSSFTTDTPSIIKYTIKVNNGKASVVNKKVQVIKD